MTRQLLIVLITLLALGIGQSVNAQNDNILTLNVPVEGRLVAGEETIWLLPLRDGAMVSVYAENVSGDIDPRISIRSNTGEELIANDDFNYPDETYALVEGFTAPRTATFAVAISGYGDTAGTYRLTVNAGYSVVHTDDILNSQSDWSLSPLNDRVESAEFDVEDDSLIVNLSGIDATSALLHNTIDVPTTAYASVNITDASGRNGWQAGIAFRATDSENFYAVTIDQRGYWRAWMMQDGAVAVLRDWSNHPAITAGTTTFNLAVFIKDSDFDVFYDGQLIGSLTDNRLGVGGGIGLIGSTANAIGSSADLRFADVRITQPAQSIQPFDLPSRIIIGNSTTAMRELKRRSRITAGGELQLTIPESSAQNIQPGISRFTLARGETYTDFVFSTTVSWQGIGSGVSGCGLIMHDAGGDTNTYSVAFVDNTGAVGIGERSGDEFTTNLFRDDMAIGTGPYQLLVISLDGQLFYYVMGQYVGSIRPQRASGGIAQAVVNYDAVDTNCRFENMWLWRWQ